MATPPYTVGWVYNLKSAPSLSDAQRVIAVAVIFSVISTIATVVRITIRIVRKFNFVSWDDIFIALSTVSRISSRGERPQLTVLLLSSSASDTVLQRFIVRKGHVLQFGLCLLTYYPRNEMGSRTSSRRLASSKCHYFQQGAFMVEFTSTLIAGYANH